MSEITKIEVQSKDKNRASLYVDGEFFAGISIELCVKHGLKKGLDIEENKLKELILQDEKEKAFTKAIKHISSALKTTQQIKEYLIKKGYSNQVIEYVIDKMTKYKYLNDEEYAKTYINTYSSKFGKMKLISQLKSRGVKDSVIDNVFNENLEINDSLSKVAEKYLKN